MFMQKIYSVFHPYKYLYYINIYILIVNSIMIDIYKISSCNIAHMFGELRRYAFHISIIHIISIIISGKSIYDNFFLLLLSTLISILVYHIFIRKLVEPDIKKMKKICK